MNLKVRGLRKNIYCQIRGIMKYKDKEYVFSKDDITNIWIALNCESALNNNKEIIVKVKEKRKIDKTFPARNRITCALEQIENDPKRYYPFLVEILQCFGSNYFDKQGTEKGRGGEITILQKVNGVSERIATVFLLSSFIIL